MTASTLALLQICDSLFPSGAFAHSYGLEQLAREGIVRTPAAVEGFAESDLRRSIAPSDGVAAYQAIRAASLDDIDAIVDADRALMRLKAASELRAASLTTGRRLLEEVAAHVSDSTLEAYRERVHADRSLGLYPVVFGVVSVTLGVEAEDAVAALLQTSLAAILQASMRLLPVSHRDVQAALHRLRPMIADAAHSIIARSDTPLRSFHPLQEIASMRHATASARLFAS